MSSSTFHDRPVFPRGFRCASRNVGLKPQAKDLAVFASDVDAAAAAIFTRNHFPGAPVIVGREIIKGGRLRAVVVNSKVSNVATGQNYQLIRRSGGSDDPPAAVSSGGATQISAQLPAWFDVIETSARTHPPGGARAKDGVGHRSGTTIASVIRPPGASPVRADPDHLPPAAVAPTTAAGSSPGEVPKTDEAGAPEGTPAS